MMIKTIDEAIAEHHNNVITFSGFAALLREIERLQRLLDTIADGARWRGWVEDGAGFNVDYWTLPNCDGRKGSLLEAAEAAGGKA